MFFLRATELGPAVEPFTNGRQSPACPTYLVLWLMITWKRMEVHSQGQTL